MCNAPYIVFRQLEHYSLLILLIQLLTFVWAQLDWDKYLRYVHLDLIMYFLILFSSLYVHDVDHYVSCLNM